MTGTEKNTKGKNKTFIERRINKILRWLGITKNPVIRVYNGYGHQDQLVVYGHVLATSPLPRKRYTRNFITNTFAMLRYFMVKPLGGAKVMLVWNNEAYEARSEDDGFFRIEWKPAGGVGPGWHTVQVSLVGTPGRYFEVTRGEGKVFVPFSNQCGYISDIDDTFLISHSTNLRKRLYVLLTKNAHSRKPFEGVVRHYQLLATSGTHANAPNPFFYVSSSEWNLYNFIVDFSKKNNLPGGIYLLSQMKSLSQVWKTGQNKHATKFMRIARILESYPKQQFVLLGDDSQMDPQIYASIVEHFPSRIRGVYLRHVYKSNVEKVRDIIARIERAGVPCCYFKHSADAIIHSKKNALIY
jgi:phosphatidate phosphatase APP1